MAIPTSARKEDRGRWKSLRGAGQQAPVALFSAEVGSPPSPSTTCLKVLGSDRVQERQLQAGSAPSPSQLCCSPQGFPQGSSHPRAQSPITLRNPTFQKDIERRGEMGVGREGTTPAEEEDGPQTAENGHLGS